jgi:RNA polymerase sigma factor (sigma-70 family)
VATTHMNLFVQHLRKTVLRNGLGITDGQLLDAFVRHKDDAALAVLVRRHGPMVWGVCCRLLRSHHDAEDAFQATFLVLVRKAATLPDKEMVGNWLFGVARQTAVRMRALAAKRGVRERQVMVMPQPTTTDHSRTDLKPLLDEALSRLPAKYRVLILFCDLEGKTRKEVARQLAVPEGTVASRLATARVMLAKRLAQRGVIVSGGLLGALLSEQAASAAAAAAAVPTVVISSTIKAVTLLAAGQAAGAGSISAPFVLTEGMLKTMLLRKLKTAGAALLVILGLSALGVGLSTRPTEAAQKDREPSASSKPAQAKVASAPQEAKPADLSAQQIVDRMTEAYADCKSYRDTGLVKTLFVLNVGNHTVEKPFTTAFVRPDRFRFEYKENVGGQETRFIIWSSAKEVQTWWDLQPGIEKGKSLDLALGGAAGVSGLASLNIPQLLLPDKLGWSRLALKEAKRADDGKLDKVECFRVEGKFGGNPITVWIDKKSYLVRRIDEQATFDTFRTEQTTTYDPTFGEKITDKMLAFDPPAPK